MYLYLYQLHKRPSRDRITPPHHIALTQQKATNIQQKRNIVVIQQKQTKEAPYTAEKKNNIKSRVYKNKRKITG